MMYFKDRTEAGIQLASSLPDKYLDQNCAVVALSDGGAVVGKQISEALNCVMMMLLMEPIRLPGEPDPVAVVNQDGGFSYNDLLTAGQLEEYTSEYSQVIEQMTRQKMYDIHRLLGRGGLIRKDLLRDHNIILVSDGLNNGFSVDVAAGYVRSTAIKRVIMATPLASVQALDRMHLETDEYHCLSPVDNYISTNHYYENNHLPKHEDIIASIEQGVLSWE